MKTTLRKMYAKIEKKKRNRYWEIELLNFFKLKKNYKKFKNWNFLKMKKKRLEIFTQGIFPPILKKIQILVAELGVDGRTDRPTDAPRQ